MAFPYGSRPCNQVLQGLALHELHRQEGLPLYLVDLMDRADADD